MLARIWILGDEWLGKIKWVSEDFPFSAPGDSGALVYALEKGTVIPLCVHLGSPTAWRHHSVGMSIETFCLDGKKGGYGRLRFAEAESRTAEEQAPNANDEDEGLTEGQLEEQRQGMEAILLANRLSSQQTSDDETHVG